MFQVSILKFQVSGFIFKPETFFLLCLFVFLDDLSAQPSQRSVETGRVMVKIKREAVPAFEKRMRTLNKTSSDTSVLNTGLKSFDLINRRYKATNMRRVFPDAGEYEDKHRQYGLHLWYEIVIPEGENSETVAAGYGEDENVQIAEPRYRIRSFSMPGSPLPPAEMPNDPDFSKQWNYNNTGQTGGTPGADIRLIDAWEKVRSLGIRNNNVIVAVIDGGVYYHHEDLSDNMWVNEVELNGVRGVDDDKNGYVDDIYGYNFVNRGGSISFEDHATHVAGVIAAVTNNEAGVAGISGNPDEGYGIKIMTVQILDGDKSVNVVGPAFAYAADNGAVISQNSWGYEDPGVYNQSDMEAINYFINEAGKDRNGNPRPGTPMTGGIVIFAAGNDSEDNKWYPAYYDNVVAVAATNHNGQLARYSNYGNWVNISAPGGEIRTGNSTGGIYSTSYSAKNNNYYEYLQGTSMACPHVSGVAALILSVYGNECYTPDMLRSRLLYSATPLEAFDPVNASVMGTGLVNASAALTPNSASEIVNDLTAQMINSVSCMLNWTIPKGEKINELSIYTVACATELINEDNFEQYALMQVVPTQVTDINMQTMVTGLQPATLYYIAIRNSDNQCDVFLISNIAKVTTRDNHAPFVSDPLPDITLRDVAKETSFYIGAVFTDDDNDDITCEIAIASARVASARIKGDTMWIQPLTAGKTTVTLTADDGNTGRTSTSLTLTITQNRAPVFNGLFADTTLIPYAGPIMVDLAEYASDPDDDPVFFYVQPIKNEVIIADVNGSMLTIFPLHHGYVELMITASDPYSAKNTETIRITVEQKYAPDKVNRLLAYPNPTNGMLWYSYILSEPASVNVRIINSVGQIVYQSPAKKRTAGTYYENINFQNWEIGMYAVQFFIDGKVADTKKVAKQ